MSTDREQLVREGITTILNADTALRTLTGRTAKIGIERGAFSVESLVPVAVVDVAEVDMSSGAMTCTVEGVARDAAGAPGGKVAREICEAAVAALIYPAFEALSLPVVPLGEVRESVAPDDGFNAVNLLGDQTLHQARVTLPLLYVE